MTELIPGKDDSQSTNELLHVALRDTHALRAVDAAECLCDRQLDVDGFELLSQATVDTDPNVRRRSLNLLGRVSYNSLHVLPLIANALEDRVWTVREAATIVLARIAQLHREQADTIHNYLLTRALHDKSQFVRDAASQSLVLLKDHTHATVDALRQALHDSRPPVRCRAVVALAYLAQYADEFVCAFLRAFDDSHFRVRRATVVAAPQFGPKSLSFIPVLVKRRFDGEPSIRQAARKSLRQVVAFSPSRVQVQFAALLDRSIQVEQVLSELLKVDDLPRVTRDEFLQVCRRRADWWRGLAGKTTASRVELDDLWMIASGIADLASQSAHVAAKPEKAKTARERELVWLLTRFVEITLRPHGQLAE